MKRNLAIVFFLISLTFWFCLAGCDSALDDVKAGWEAQERNDLDEAVKLYTKAIDSGKLSQEDLGVTHLNRGVIYHNRKEYDLALNDYDSAIDSSGLSEENLGRAYYNRGIIYYEKGEFDKGKEDFDKVVDLNPEDANAYFNRAFGHEKQGMYDEAISDYTKAIDTGQLSKEDLGLALYRRGLFYREKSLYHEAIKDLERAIELRPEDPNPINSIAWLLATCPNPECRDGKKAVEFSQKAVSMGKNSRNLDTLAAAYAEMGDFEMAIKTETEAISICTDAQRKKDLEEVLEAYKKRITYVQLKEGKN